MKKKTVCPECGEVMKDVVIGWKCKKCKGFISFLDGKFYDCVEKQLSTPMTNADRIRAMNDLELAKWISGGATKSDSACSFCIHNKEKICTGQECQNKSDVDIIMEWLREPEGK